MAHRPEIIHCSICGAPRSINGRGRRSTDLCKKCQNARDRESRKLSKRRNYQHTDARVASWKCLHDPDGDFTGKNLQAEEIKCMVKDCSFSPGALLQNAGGAVFLFDGRSLKAVQAAVMEGA